MDPLNSLLGERSLKRVSRTALLDRHPSPRCQGSKIDYLLDT